MDRGSAAGSDKLSTTEFNILYATHTTFAGTGAVGFVVGQPIAGSDTASASLTHLIVLADRSGSMSGSRIAKVNALLRTWTYGAAPNSNLVFGTFDTVGG